jgi:hypothetical protein
MAVLSVQDEFQSGDNVTATNLNNLVKDAKFNADTTDNSTLEVHTTGYLKVKDLGVDTQHLADGAVETAKIGDDQVTYAKMQDVAAYSVIGNKTNATATPTAISIDDLKDNISNATPHDGGSADSDGLNTTGGSDGLLSAYDKTKLNSIAVNANNFTYTHPIGDGNLHVPATGTTNEGKILTAGSTAGSLTWETAPANEVITSNWALNVDSDLGFNATGGSTYTGTSPDNVQASRLFYHRCGRLAVLSGYIRFFKTTSVYTRITNTENNALILLLCPEDTLVTGGTARIYPERDVSNSNTIQHFTKSAGAGFATLQGGPTNSTTSAPDFFTGNARIGEIPGLANPLNQDDILSIRIFNAQDTYAAFLYFETQFLLSNDFA